MISNPDSGIERAISAFDRDTNDRDFFQTFMKSFMEGVSVAGLPMDFSAKQLSLIPERYRRLKTRDPNKIHSGETEVFAPHGLVDHLALIYYNGFNIFDLFDDSKGYTTLELNGERFYFVLMRNMPISALASEENKKRFEYRLVIWDDSRQLIGFRNHYVQVDFPYDSSRAQTVVRGYWGAINVDFYGRSVHLGLNFEKPSNDGVWTRPDHRKRGIGRTLENIASGFIPAELLGIRKVVVQPGTKESKDFYWAVGYDDGNGWTMGSNRDFPKVMTLPRNPSIVLEMLKASGQVINQDYSPTWQYARLLSLEKRTV